MNARFDVDRVEEDRQQLAALPGMTSRRERWLLRNLARSELSGEGEIVDLGCWLGFLTASLAAGVRENPALLRKGRKIHAFDSFVWISNYMDPFWASDALALRPADGGSFLPAFEAIVAHWQDLIVVHVADLESEQWSGDKIELLSVDAMKTVDVAKNVIASFFPFLVEKVGYVFQQDFCHKHTWWIHLYHYLLRDHFELVKYVERAEGVLFRVVRAVTQQDAARVAEADLSDPLLADRAFAFSMDLVAGWNRKQIAAAFEQCELHHERQQRAQAIRETYDLSSPDTFPLSEELDLAGGDYGQSSSQEGPASPLPRGAQAVKVPQQRIRLTQDEALEILLQSFHQDVASLNAIGEGETVQAFAFQVGERDYVACFSFTRYGFDKDKYVHDHFQIPELPMPKIAYLSEIRDGLFLSVTELAKGDKCSTITDGYFNSIIPECIVDIIISNRNSKIESKKFGPWSKNGEAFYREWRDFLTEEAASFRRELHFPDGGVEFEGIDNIILKYESLIQYCSDRRNLVHGDFGRHNLFFDGKRISEVIDWDNSMFGDYLYDLATIEFRDNITEYERIFIEKARVMGFSEGNFYERTLCYKLHFGLSTLYWYKLSSQENSEACAFIVRQLGDLMARERKAIASHFYQNLDRDYYDYDLHRVWGLGEQLYRGPSVDLSRPYIVCIGAAQTFGRFCARPFPTLLADRLGRQVLNLGIGGVGPRLFDNDSYREILNKADLVIVQALSARSEGNSFFDNSRTGNLMGTRLLDGKEMRFEEFLDEFMQTQPLESVYKAVKETRERYIEGMIKLLDGINAPKILFSISNNSPDRPDDYSSVWKLLGPFPQLVNRPMIDAISLHCDSYVECISQDGIPQPLWPADTAIDGTELQNGMLVNRYYPSPEMHAQAAELLLPECVALLPAGTRATPPAASVAAAKLDYSPFIILCAERTGSNLLVGLINSDRRVFAGGELFNPVLIETGVVPWSISPAQERDRLNALRRADPIALLEHLYAVARGKGHRNIGFKLMYSHADKQKTLREHLRADRGVKVIHLKRRNLLRRYLSERRAALTGIWAMAKNDAMTRLPRPQLDFQACVANFSYIETKQAEYDAIFREHDLLEIFYEDLEVEPQLVGARVLAFLGLEERSDLAIHYAKSGIDPLRDAIANHDELKAHFRRWADFFED